MPRSKKLVRESIRGLVPSSAVGITDTVYGTYLKELDPAKRDDVRFALAASSDTRFQAFLARLGEARSTSRPKGLALQTIAKQCGIALDEFAQWYGKASTQRAIATAQSAAPEVMIDMSQDARTQKTVCPKCDGLRWLGAAPGWPLETPGYRQMSPADPDSAWIRDCPMCTDGKIATPGDEHSRDRLLETAGLINKKGPMVAVVQNFNGSGMTSAIPRFQTISMDD